MVVHDVVSIVVRDIVGIFESLLDRLLFEKKNDTIRTIVAELVTEDVSATIAAGREQLKRQELGHISSELGRLRMELREAEAVWEERFRVTSELRDSQDDLWVTLDERCRGSESRLGVLEREFVHGSELDARLKAVTEEMDSLRDTVSANKAKVDKAFGSFDNFQTHCKEHFLTKAMLDSMEQRVDKSLENFRAHVDTVTQDLRSDCAPKSELADLKLEHDDRIRHMSSELFHVTQDVDLLKTQLKKDQRDNASIFATKLEQKAVIDNLTNKKEAMESHFLKIFDQLEASAATKEAFEVEQKRQEEKHGSILEKVTDTSKSFEAMTSRLANLETLCSGTHSWATKDYVDEVAEERANKVARELSEKHTIAQLRRDFEEERERLRQQTRQQQNTRKDLNDLSEVVHGVKRQSLDVTKQLGGLTERMDRVVSNEADHWQKVLSDSAELRHGQSDLDRFCQALRDELKGHIKFQEAEGEKLRQHSTERYLEQMDKALLLNTNLGKLESVHKELRDTVTKLPRVT
jgi:chromosome segregation ATPase